MCGIAGYIGKDHIPDDRIQHTLDLMTNRGPNFRDFKRLNFASYQVVLLHTRLSILDLDARANQPLSRDDHSLVYNGEVYNYIELRANLEKQGVSFSTNSDTEVLLQSLICDGDKAFDALEGMWAFALCNERDGSVLLSRDRFGEKPLFYFEAEDGIYFASEIKSLRALMDKPLRVNTEHLRRYLVNGFRALYKTKDTFFHGVKELPRASSMMIHRGKLSPPQKYWNPSLQSEKDMTFSEATNRFKNKFLNALEIRLRSDVPIAFCLSGGLDSSSIISSAVKEFSTKASAFSIIDSDPRYNERDKIEETLAHLGIDGCMVELNYDGFFDRLTDLICYHDSPVSTISYYVHSFLSESIAKQGFKVALSGTGADEMLTGYYDHFNLHLAEMQQSPHYEQLLSDWQKHISPLVRNPFLKDPLLYQKNAQFRDHIYLNRDTFSDCLIEPFEEEFFEERYCDSLLRNRMLNEMFHEIVPVILHEDDCNSMMFSVENRSPFLDRSLFEFCASIPSQHLIGNGYGKQVLRCAMEGIVNDSVRLNREKKGFNASINSLVDFDSQEVRDFLLADSPVFEIVKRETISSLFKSEKLPNSISKFLFNFINTKLFLENYS